MKLPEVSASRFSNRARSACQFFRSKSILETASLETAAALARISASRRSFLALKSESSAAALAASPASASAALLSAAAAMAAFSRAQPAFTCSNSSITDFSASRRSAFALASRASFCANNS